MIKLTKKAVGKGRLLVGDEWISNGAWIARKSLFVGELLPIVCAALYPACNVIEATDSEILEGTTGEEWYLRQEPWIKVIDGVDHVMFGHIFIRREWVKLFGIGDVTRIGDLGPCRCLDGDVFVMPAVL